MAMGASMVQRGQNPAAAAYKLAEMHGYKKNEAGQVSQIIKEVQNEPEDRLFSADRKRSTGLTPEVVAEMGDADFDKITDSQWRRMFGG